MLADSGARKSELLERTWNDLDIANAKMIVPMTKNGYSRILFFFASHNKFGKTNEAFIFSSNKFI
jgi:integrase